MKIRRATKLSEALRPLLRIIRIQNLDGDDTNVDYSYPQIRMRSATAVAKQNLLLYTVA